MRSPTEVRGGSGEGTGSYEERNKKEKTLLRGTFSSRLEAVVDRRDPRVRVERGEGCRKWSHPFIIIGISIVIDDK